MNADKSEIERSLGLLFRPDDTVEMRSLGSRVISGFYRDRHELAEAACKLNANLSPPQNVYVCLNPVEPQLYARRPDTCGHAKKGEATKDQEVESRRWTLVDIDPVRPSGVSASDKQKQAAIELAKRVYSWLVDSFGANSIVQADSGNGMHMLLALADLPNDKQTAKACQCLLSILDEQFSNDRARVDTTTSNAARICTLYGTIKCKGGSTEEQPHRPSRLLHVPESIERVSLEKLEAVTGQRAPEKPVLPRNGNGTGWDIRRLLEHRDVEYRAERGQSESGEPWTTYHIDCPFSDEHDDGFVIGQWDNGAVFAKCHHDSCQGKDWDELKHIWELRNAVNVTPPAISIPNESHGAQQPHLVITKSRDIQTEEVEWLVPDCFVIGGINLLCGRGGVGKTYQVCDLVARITNKSLQAPNGGPIRHGRVLYSTGEDHVAKIIEPRMQAHGVDRDYLEYIKGLQTKDTIDLLNVMEHIQYLRDALIQRPDTVALVLDPISSFMGDADHNKVTQVRQFTSALSQLSEDHNLAILGIHHFSKSKRDNAGDSISGSHAYRDAARSVWLFALDKNDASRRLMVCDKHNWAEQRPTGQAYTIEKGRIVYEPDPLVMSSDDLLGQSTQTPRDIAKTWLCQELSEGPMPAKPLQIAAETKGITGRTLNRAKDDLGVESFKEGNSWYWRLKEETNSTA